MPQRLLSALGAFALATALVAAGLIAGPVPASAATRGAGFGTWAPLSALGWHGSMIVDGVHTYCILPGAPLPTGATNDHGVRTDAAGLSAEQLTRVNFLVSTYGQTDDPVQAAAVGWAVKATADWAGTLRGFGYRGDSLAGAIDAVFHRLAPAENAEVQRRATTYYDEAQRIPAGAADPTGALVFTTSADDHRSGTVRVDATAPGARGTLTLEGATFVESGTTSLDDVVVGSEHAIQTKPAETGRPYSVAGRGTLRMGFAPAVRSFTTPGGQDTAGPGGTIEFEVTGADAAPRIPPFVPTITTQVPAAYLAAGAPYLDAVSVTLADGEWARSENGEPLPVAASAVVYRTENAPTPSAAAPDDAVEVGTLDLVTDPAHPIDEPYSAASDWMVSEPGFYIAVWSIRREDQTPEVAQHLPEDFQWQEQFATPSQIAVAPGITTRAQETSEVGEPISDTIIVSPALTEDGLEIVAALHRADGGEPGGSCRPDTLVWESEPLTVTEAGEYVVTSPTIADAGTYYWQERATDAAGLEVHRGVCGIENETTRVTAATVPAPRAESALAATGSPTPLVRPLLIASGATLLGIALLRGTRRWASPESRSARTG